MTKQLLQTLHIVSIGIVILYIFKVLLSYFRTHLILYLSRRMDIQLMLGYYHHVVGLPMNFLKPEKSVKLFPALWMQVKYVKLYRQLLLH